MLPALAFSFTLTFTVFPAVIQDTSYKFMSGWEKEDSYFILMTLTLFNVSDTVGRYAASVSCMQLGRPVTLLLAYLRGLFLITILLTAFEVGPDWLFNSDWWKILSESAFAFTNGWLTSLCIILAPMCVQEKERGGIGALISPVLLGGICLGTLIALPME